MTTVVDLREAGPECGGKAHGLAVLLRHGFDVPDGFVVTGPAGDFGPVAGRLARLGSPAVAVRSSGLAEDSAAASFAGQLETVLGVRGDDRVRAAIERCAASGRTPRALAYRARLGLPGTPTPVIVQEMVAADRAGVLFTRDPRTGADTVVINASWGLGQSVVAGEVVPDEITGGAVRIGAKATRLDLGEHGPVRSDVPPADRARPCLTGAEIAELTALGRRCAEVFGGPQDIEWAIAGGRVRLLQSRPVTALAVPAPTPGGPGEVVLVTGAPGSPGRASGPARPVLSVDGFAEVRSGDVLVCRTTDPAWTPLFRVVAAVVTENGGLLSHAAIVAREYGIPAVAGATGALARIPAGRRIAVDGGTGAVLDWEGRS